MHELISFHAAFKPFQHTLDEKSIIEIMELEGSSRKAIRHFSSGMKQRLKIALAVLSKAPVLLMDEPLSNLDRQGTSWYRNMIENFAAAKTIIICSNNIEEEIAFCERRINLHDYKV
ncbi:MAG: ATP-binding cassette domain-containing protein [Bacteroidia bacterium]|nr:ATP-binding cassette domain-containing protein [Bacteroidia bacterium]